VYLNDYVNSDSNLVTKKFLAENNTIIFNLERLIVSFISNSNRTEIIKFSYDSTKKNNEFIGDIFDDKLLSELKNEITEYDGIEWRND